MASELVFSRHIYNLSTQLQTEAGVLVCAAFLCGGAGVGGVVLVYCVEGVGFVGVVAVLLDTIWRCWVVVGVVPVGSGGCYPDLPSAWCCSLLPTFYFDMTELFQNTLTSV